MSNEHGHLPLLVIDHVLKLIFKEMSNAFLDSRMRSGVLSCRHIRLQAIKNSFTESALRSTQAATRANGMCLPCLASAPSPSSPSSVKPFVATRTRPNLQQGQVCQHVGVLQEHTSAAFGELACTAHLMKSSSTLAR